MRELTPLRREVIERLPRLRFIASTGQRNISFTQLTDDLFFNLSLANLYDVYHLIEGYLSSLNSSYGGAIGELIRELPAIALATYHPLGSCHRGSGRYGRF
jgi:hypothetical protein